MAENNLPRYMDAICEAWQKCLKPPYGSGDFSPEDGQTDCNRFVNSVCENLGYFSLKGLRANEMFDFLTNSKTEWLKVGCESAQYYANKGYVVVAAWKNPDPSKSGHVAIVRPGEPCTSKKWGYNSPKVPKVANVGKAETCRIDRGANYAFGEEPSYFVLRKDSEVPESDAKTRP